MAIRATTQPCDGDHGSTATRESRQAMMEDAMGRARQGSEPNFDGAPDMHPTTDWTTPTPPYPSNAYQKPGP